MTEIEKMRRHIANTRMNEKTVYRYEMDIVQLGELMEMTHAEGIHLAYLYGLSRGYRAGRRRKNA